MMDNISRLIKLVRELQKEIKKLQDERDYWRNRYIDEVVGTDSEPEKDNFYRNIKL
jgi:hypothetical protein